MSIWSRIERRLTDLAGEILPDDVHEQLTLARQHLRDDDPTTAAEILGPVVEARPDHLGALSLLGVAELQRGRHDEALAAFDQAIGVRQSDPDAHVGRGQVLFAMERLDEAAVAFRNAVETAGGDREILAVAYRGAGLTFRRLDKLDKAVRELRKAVAESPRDPLALASLGEALHAHPEISDEEAKKYLGWAREGDAPALAYLVSGQIALSEARIEEARELFTVAAARAEVAAQNDERTAAMLGTADVGLATGQLADAHEALMRALELAPESVEVHARLAGLHERSGSAEAALASYQRASDLGTTRDVLAAAVKLAIDSGDQARISRFGEKLAALAEPETAEADLGDIAGAIVLREDGDHESARSIYRQILQRGDNPDAHLGLALEFIETDPKAAAEHALAALRAAPIRTRQRARELLRRARRAELGVDDGESISEDLIATLTGLERLCLARTELSSLARGVAEAASDFDRPLLVTVMGEFSSGKSTFVNAFIGAEVAPTGITPTTATINVVRYGRERGGRILYRDDASEDVPWAELFDRLRQLSPGEAERISRVEILLPLEILERVNLVDTPGLNSILPEHEKVARDFIARADAVVWVFSAGQAGKKTEGQALAAITDQGVRVLGALNKVDQLSPSDIEKVAAMVNQELGDKLEAIVPVSARLATEGKEGSRWPDLELALETHFFARANKLKESAVRRKLAEIFTQARARVGAQRRELADGSEKLASAAAALREHAYNFEAEVAGAERRAISNELGTLYRDAALEVLELVLPRSLPFGSHKATRADRDYLISLLETRLEQALTHSRRRVEAAIRALCGDALRAEIETAPLLGASSAALSQSVSDATLLFDARVYTSALAYLRGYLRGGYVEHFFRVDLPKLDLAEDAVYHALYRDSPNVDALVGKKLAEAGGGALLTIAERLEAMSRVLSAAGADLEEGSVAALDSLEARRGSGDGSS